MTTMSNAPRLLVRETATGGSGATIGTCSRAVAAAFTLLIRSWLISIRRSDASAVGFWMKSTAPASSALRASSPASLATLTMTMGRGLRAICSVTKPTPSRLGMMRSHVTTSGFRVRHLIESLEAVSGGTDDFHVRTARQHLRDDLAHVCGIVHDKNPGYSVGSH